MQFVMDVQYTESGVMMTTYKSKRKFKPMVWAALKRGFGECVWADAFQESCSRAHLPKNDFLVLRPTVDFKGFTRYPAGWSDANRALHALLVMSGMEVEEVVRYSMHFCRHVYPTCAFQLLFPPPAVTLMGNWCAKTDKSSGI